MFLDDVVVAGLLVVGGTIVFMLGFAFFIYQDAHKKKSKPKT